MWWVRCARSGTGSTPIFLSCCQQTSLGASATGIRKWYVCVSVYDQRPHGLGQPDRKLQSCRSVCKTMVPLEPLNKRSVILLRHCCEVQMVQCWSASTNHLTQLLAVFSRPLSKEINRYTFQFPCNSLPKQAKKHACNWAERHFQVHTHTPAWQRRNPPSPIRLTQGQLAESSHERLPLLPCTTDNHHFDSSRA